MDDADMTIKITIFALYRKPRLDIWCYRGRLVYYLMENGNLNITFHELFRQKDRFIRFAYFYVLDRQVAEDLVMDSFMYYWENKDTIDVCSNLPAYILTVLKHKALDYLKLQKIHLEAHERIREDALWDMNKSIACLEALEPYEIYTEENRREVIAAVNQLSDKTREIFIMSRMHDMTYSEIAKAMGLSEKAVEYHMSKAIKTLREKLRHLYILTFFIF